MRAALFLLLAAAAAPMHGHQHDTLPDFAGTDAARGAEAAANGRYFFTEIQKTYALVADPVVNQYVHDLAHSLINQSRNARRHFHVFVVADGAINAFAGPDGYIGVHTGLMSAVANEGELAAVLAHEIAHVASNHLARLGAEIEETSVNPLVQAGLLFAGVYSNNADAAIASIVLLQGRQADTMLNYSRLFEEEADRTGMAILRDAGFSDHHMSAFFTRLLQNDAGTTPLFLRTHPQTRDRLAASLVPTQQRATVQHTASNTANRTNDFALIQARLAPNKSHARHLDKTDNTDNLTRSITPTNPARTEAYQTLIGHVRAERFREARAFFKRLPADYRNHFLFRLEAANAASALGDPVPWDSLHAQYPYHLALQKLYAEHAARYPATRHAAINYLQAAIAYAPGTQGWSWRWLYDVYRLEDYEGRYYYARAQAAFHFGYMRNALGHLQQALTYEDTPPSAELTYADWHYAFYRKAPPE